MEELVGDLAVGDRGLALQRRRRIGADLVDRRSEPRCRHRLMKNEASRRDVDRSPSAPLSPDR
jgi:hypothetical protein